MPTFTKENDQKSKTAKKARRGILTNHEKEYLLSSGCYNSYKEHVIKLKTKKTFNEDLPLLFSLRPDYLDVRTFHMVRSRTEHEVVDTPVDDEPILLDIFEDRLIDAVMLLYRLYEEQIQEEIMKVKSKRKVAEKEVWKKVNKIIRKGKDKVRQGNKAIQEYKQRQTLGT